MNDNYDVKARKIIAERNVKELAFALFAHDELRFSNKELVKRLEEAAMLLKESMPFFEDDVDTWRTMHSFIVDWMPSQQDDEVVDDQA